MQITQAPIQTKSLKDALTKATHLGFSQAETAIGTHRPIDEWLKELSESGGGCGGYALFGSVIVRIRDVWQRDAEVVHPD
jgi:hypothetical protein